MNKTLLIVIVVIVLIVAFIMMNGDDNTSVMVDSTATANETSTAEPQKPNNVMDALESVGKPAEADTSGLPLSTQSPAQP